MVPFFFVRLYQLTRTAHLVRLHKLTSTFIFQISEQVKATGEPSSSKQRPSTTASTQNPNECLNNLIWKVSQVRVCGKENC